MARGQRAAPRQLQAAGRRSGAQAPAGQPWRPLGGWGLISNGRRTNESGRRRRALGLSQAVTAARSGLGLALVGVKMASSRV